MSLTRRQFVQAVAASTAGAVAFTGCVAPGSVHEFRMASHVRAPEDLANAEDNWYATLCPQCEAGLGVIVRIVGGRAKKLEGNPDYPVNAGKLSAQGQAAVQELYHPDRITGPLRRSGARFSGSLDPVSWDEGLGELVNRLRPLAGAQPGSVLLATSPLRGHQALVVDRFARGIGARRATFEPLERKAMAREAVRRVFGFDQLPELDIAGARHVLSFGADFLGTWLSPVHYSRAFGEFRHGRPGVRGRLTHVEPRMSPTAAAADRWVAAKPGSEGILALSIANALVASGKADPNGLGALGGAQALAAYEPAATAEMTGVRAETVAAIANDLATLRPSLVLGGDSAAAHTNGIANLVAIYSLNLLLGNVGAAGGIIPNPAPPIAVPSPTSTTFADWQRLADALRGGQVSLALVHDANPVYGLPTLGLHDALAKVPYVVSFSSFLDETTALADLILPDHHSLESWGTDVPDPGPGYATVGFQQPVVAPFADTRSFSDLLLVVAAELGGTLKQQLPWSGLKDLLQQAATQLQDLGGGSVPAGTPEEYWTRLLQRGGWWDPQKKGALAASAAGTASRSIAVSPPSFEGSEQEYPYNLHVYSSGALHEGQYAHLPWLQGLPDPMTTVVWATWVELNPETAAKLGVSEGDTVTVESPVGSLEAPVYVYPAIRPDVVAMPLGQGHTTYTQYASGRGVNPLSILAPRVDAETGSHAWSATRVRLRKTDKPRGQIPKFEGMVKPFIPETIPMIQGTQARQPTKG